MPRADLLDRARRIGAVLLALPELAARVDLIASGLSGVARLASRVGAVRVGVEDLRAELAAVRVEVEALRAERDAAAQRARDVLDDAAARIASNHASLSRVVEALEPRPRVRPTLAELVRDEEAP